MLSDRDIERNLDLHIGIEPYWPKQLQPCSYDVVLGDSFTTYDTFFMRQKGFLDVREDISAYARTRIDESWVIHPGQLVLATTWEKISLCEHFAARIEGKSSLARLGLMVHTAGFVDAGFVGQLTLEITNHLGVPIELYSQMPIAQLAFFELSSPAMTTYVGKYQNQEGATASKYNENFK